MKTPFLNLLYEVILMPVRIVSDSSSNLFKLEGVDYAVVPLKIVAGDKEYVDVPNLDVERMLRELAEYGGKSGTSCPNAAEWLDAFGGADTVFAITITGALSGSFACADQARREYIQLHPKANIFVLDSLSAGPELQLILEKLRELVLAGKDFAEIRDGIVAYSKSTRLLFALQSLQNLAANGRVSPVAAKLAGLLGIRLVGRASAQGTLELLHKCRYDAVAIRKLTDEMAHQGFRGGKVRVAHCLNEPLAARFADAVRDRFGASDISIVPCTALCSFYAERGGLMIGYEGCPLDTGG